MPEANREYWTGKIRRNVERDQRKQQALQDLGWEFRIIWECELSVGIAAVVAELHQRRFALDH